MIFGLALFGIFHGYHGRTGSSRDFRHCFPNIHRMIVEPLQKQGHVVKVFVCTYPIQEHDASQAFFDIVKPEHVVWCEFSGSNQYTTKSRLFECLVDRPELDVIIYSRCDMHYSISIDELSIDWEKFNFLFREKDHWENLRYATDNIYIWPHRMTAIVRKAMSDAIAASCARGRVDTHNLYNFLTSYVSPEDVHFVSDVHALSDVNIFYSICRNDLPDRPCLHPEVRALWKDSLISVSKE